MAIIQDAIKLLDSFPKSLQVAKRKEKEALEAERKAAIKEKEAQVGSSYFQH